MFIVIKRAIAKHKEEKARRNLVKGDKHILGSFGPIALALDHYGRLVSPSDVAYKNEYGDDSSSVSSFSTTATMNDNPGAGYTIDKYFYQPVGRRVERLLSRIALPFLSPGRIFQYIEKNLFTGKLCFTKSYTVLPYFELNPVYLAGLHSLLLQTR